MITSCNILHTESIKKRHMLVTELICLSAGRRISYKFIKITFICVKRVFKLYLFSCLRKSSFAHTRNCPLTHSCKYQFIHWRNYYPIHSWPYSFTHSWNYTYYCMELLMNEFIHPHNMYTIIFIPNRQISQKYRKIPKKHGPKIQKTDMDQK